MPYFNKSADKYDRIGKVIGDAISAFLVVALIIIFSYSMISR